MQSLMLHCPSNVFLPLRLDKCLLKCRCVNTYLDRKTGQYCYTGCIKDVVWSEFEFIKFGLFKRSMKFNVISKMSLNHKKVYIKWFVFDKPSDIFNWFRFSLNHFFSTIIIKPQTSFVSQYIFCVFVGLFSLMR